MALSRPSLPPLITALARPVVLLQVRKERRVQNTNALETGEVPLIERGKVDVVHPLDGVRDVGVDLIVRRGVPDAESIHEVV